MNQKMLIIEPDGQSEFRDVPITYPAFNHAVLDGGYMQEMRCITPEGEQVVFLMDEEGKYKNLAPNIIATSLWYSMGGAQLMPGDVFCGRVAVCGTAGDSLAEMPKSAQAIVNGIPTIRGEGDGMIQSGC